MALLTLLLLVLEICVAVRSEVELQKRIYGGQTCNNDERRYHVKLYENDDPGSLCGGSLISDQWVLTAAHCWQTGPGWVHKVVVGVHPKFSFFSLKTWHLSKKTLKITDNPVKYTDQNNNQHDIMLVKLPKKITSVKPVQLPDCNKPIKKGDTVQMAGLGIEIPGPYGLKSIGTLPNSLQCADFKVENIDLSDHRGHIFSLETTGVNKVDICPGDSGGGAVHNNMIYGVHSGSGDKVCVKPALEMDVCKYEKWISETIKPNCDSFSCIG